MDTLDWRIPVYGHFPPLTLGTVVSVRRYPVKSMQGEELNAAWVTSRGVFGDRALALVDAETGKVVSAKNPRKWPAMFDFRSEFVEPPRPGSAAAGADHAAGRHLPDQYAARYRRTSVAGTIAPRRLSSAAFEQPVLEEYWPDMEEFHSGTPSPMKRYRPGRFSTGPPCIC